MNIEDLHSEKKWRDGLAPLKGSTNHGGMFVSNSSTYVHQPPRMIISYTFKSYQGLDFERVRSFHHPGFGDAFFFSQWNMGESALFIALFFYSSATPVTSVAGLLTMAAAALIGKHRMQNRAIRMVFWPGWSPRGALDSSEYLEIFGWFKYIDQWLWLILIDDHHDYQWLSIFGYFFFLYINLSIYQSLFIQGLGLTSQ